MQALVLYKHAVLFEERVLSSKPFKVIFMSHFIICFLITYLITRVVFFVFDFSSFKPDGVTFYFIDFSFFALVYFVVYMVVNFIFDRVKG